MRLIIKDCAKEQGEGCLIDLEDLEEIVHPVSIFKRVFMRLKQENKNFINFKIAFCPEV